MFKIKLIGAFVMLSLFSLAQDFNDKGYTVQSTGNKYAISEIEEAIDAANWCSYRYMNQRQVLNFKSGIVIQLHSITEMKLNQIVIDESCAAQDDFVLTDEFMIHEGTRKIVRLREKKQIK